MFYLGHLSPQELKNNQRDRVLAETLPGHIVCSVSLSRSTYCMRIVAR